MDIRYENALRTATQAWGRNQPTDALTLRTLKTQAQRMQEMRASLSHPTPTQAAVLQPELARYGNLGTKLNVYA